MRHQTWLHISLAQLPPGVPWAHRGGAREEDAAVQPLVLRADPAARAQWRWDTGWRGYAMYECKRGSPSSKMLANNFLRSNRDNMQHISLS